MLRQTIFFITLFHFAIMTSGATPFSVKILPYSSWPGARD